MKGAPYLAGVIACAASAFAAETSDEYWVEPMKEVSASFTGERGTVAQFGDSITISMAFFAPLRLRVRNLPDGLKEAHAWMRGYVRPECWRG